MKTLIEFKNEIKNRQYPKFDNNKFEECKPILEQYQKKYNISEKSVKDLFEVLNSTTIYSLKLCNLQKQLIFVGAIHVKREPDSKWFLDLLNEIFLNYQPDSILIEAVSDRKTFIPKEPDNSEGDRIIKLSNELNIPIKGMDAKKERMFGIFVEYNLIDAGIFIWLINFYKYKKINNSKEEALNEAIDLLFEDLTTGWFSNYLQEVEKLMLPNENLRQAILRLSQQAVEKYIDPDLDIISALENKFVYPPFPYCNKYQINLIRALWSEERDNSMIQNCVNMLEKYEKVFAIAGMGHIQVIRHEILNKLKEEFPDYDIEYKRYIDYIK